MNRVASRLLALAVAACLAGCGGKTDDDSSSRSPERGTPSSGNHSAAKAKFEAMVEAAKKSDDDSSSRSPERGTPSSGDYASLKATFKTVFEAATKGDDASSSRSSRRDTPGSGDYSSPKATFETMVEAAKGGDKDAVMACFCEADRKNLAELEKIAKEIAKLEPEARGMQGEITEQIMKMVKKADFELGGERINGDKATLSVKEKGKKREEKIKFVQEEGGWRMVLGIPDEAVEQAKKRRRRSRR